MRVMVKRSAFKAAGLLPPKTDLREMDLLSFAHDRELRDRDARVWKGDIEKDDKVYCALSNNAHLKLRKGLDAIRWTPLIAKWKQAKSAMRKRAWQGMGSLIHYEKDLANFSRLVLDLAIYSDTPIDIDSPLAVPDTVHVDVRLAPPVINSRKISVNDLRDEDPAVSAGQARKDIRHLMEQQKAFKAIRAENDD